MVIENTNKKAIPIFDLLEEFSEEDLEERLTWYAIDKVSPAAIEGTIREQYIPKFYTLENIWGCKELYNG